ELSRPPQTGRPAGCDGLRPGPGSRAAGAVALGPPDRTPRSASPGCPPSQQDAARRRAYRRKGPIAHVRTEMIEMSDHTETGDVTGTKDKNYNLIWFVEACLSNALRMEEYCRD